MIGYVLGLVQLARSRTTRQAFYVSLATGFACFAPQLAFFWGIFGASAIALWMILALWTVAFVVLTRLAIVQLGLGRAAFLTPFLWTGLEYFRSELYYLKFSWLNVGYAFAEVPYVPWRFIGTYGMGFGLVAAVVVVLQIKRVSNARLRRIFSLAAFGVVTLFAMAVLPMTLKSQPPSNLAFGGVQLEFVEEEKILSALDDLLTEYPLHHRTNFSLDRQAGLPLAILPEYALTDAPSEALRDWSRTNEMFLIVGGKDASPETNYFNTAFVISTNGEIVFKQGKSVPIQFFADGMPAAEQKVWESPWGKIGICICYDLSYTRVTDELVRQGARMLIVPTMDVANWGRHQHELHARIAPVRAAEYGIPIFRVASSGISQGVEANGRVQVIAPFPGEGERLYFAANLERRGEVPPDRLLAILSTGITGIFIVRAVIARLFRRRADR